MLVDRDNAIDELERQINSAEAVSSHGGSMISAPSVKSIKPVLPPKKLNWYRPIKGDLIDELIAKHFNALSRPMPIKRLGDGFYIFGSRKIYVKLLAGRLVVRVGGGFMSINEFMEQYAEMEMQKVLQMMENGTFNIEDFEGTGKLSTDLSTTPSKLYLFHRYVQRETERADRHKAEAAQLHLRTLSDYF